MTNDLSGIYLWVDTPGVTLRSASGNREAVIIDGNYTTTEIITIAASNVTVADLTLRRAYTHPIHVVATSSSDTINTRIYNVRIIDPGEQAIKINPNGDRTHFPDLGEVACSHIELTDAGRAHVRNCYTGGIDAHQAQGWIIRDNVIEGFWCENGLSEHAVHMWRGCRDTLVERNVLKNNARGIGFGLGADGTARIYPDDPCPGANSGFVEHYGGIIRNNFVSAASSPLFGSEYGFDCGICLWQACRSQVLHNTVASSQPPFSSIEWRFENTDADIVNNLVTHNLRDRGGTARLSGNLANQPLSLFVDGPAGDLHLTSGATVAIDGGVALSANLCDDDIDGDSRPIGPARDIGADESGVPVPEAVADLRITHAVTGTGTVTVNLRWTAPANAISTTLRYSAIHINETNWNEALILAEDLPAGSEALTSTLPFDGHAVFVALRSQNAVGDWSPVSNNVAWTLFRIMLPLGLR